ncbi:hypothetical protein [Streptomyces sp. NPDC000880]
MAWATTICVAFVVDTFSRRIVGWSAATAKHTELVLAALEMRLWQRDRDGHPARLVAETGLSNRAITKIVDRLVPLGYVDRARDPVRTGGGSP